MTTSNASVSTDSAMRTTLVALASTFVALACAMAAHRLLQGTQAYSQLVVGALAWGGDSKGGDLAAALVFLTVLPIAWWALGVAANAYRTEASAGLGALQLACAPGVAWLAQAMLSPWSSTSWLYVCAALVVWWAVGSQTIGGSRHRQATDPGSTQPDASMAFLLVPTLCGFSALGLLLLVNRVLLRVVHVPAFPIGFCLGAGAMLLLLRRAGANASTPSVDWRRVVQLAQIGIPLLAAGLFPTPLLHGTELLRVAPFSLPLAGLAMLVAIFVIVDIVRSPRREGGAGIASFASPLALFLCLWILRSPFTDVPVLSTDDWHFGELILPWAEWRDFGLVPYADVMPVRGFISLADAGLAQLFMSGSAADLAHVRPVIALLYSALAFVAMRYAAGTLAALVAVAVLDFASPITRIDYLFVAGVCLQAGLVLRGRGSRSALAWLFTSISFAVLAPGQALLYAVATAPLLAYALWHSNGAGRAAFAGAAAAMLVAFIALSFVSPTLAQIRVGVQLYFADNVAVNTTGSGIPWAKSFTPQQGSPVVREAFRSFFLIVAASMLWAVVQAYRRTGHAACSAMPIRARLRRLDRTEIAIAASIVVTVLVFLPRVLGRIDVDSATRLGALTLLTCALTPLVTSRRFRPTSRGALALLLIFVASGIQVIAGTPSEGGTSFATNALGLARQFNSVDGLIDESVSKLHRVGTAHFDGAHLDELQHVRRLLDDMLPARTPYYDFSNRNAHYVYFDRPVATRWSSPYYLADERAQIRTAGELATRRVPLLLLGANNLVHDGGGAALRSYWLYRYVLADYVPFDRDGYVFAVRRELAGRPPFAAFVAGQIADVVLFEDVFAVSDLKGIPLAWGLSQATLGSSFGPDRVDARPAAGGGGRTTLGAGAADADRAGLARFDMLRLSLRCDRPGESMRLAWSSRRQGTTTHYDLAFDAGSGVLLVPVGSRPGWTMADETSDVSLDAGTSGCHVDAAQWLQRRRPQAAPR